MRIRQVTLLLACTLLLLSPLFAFNAFAVTNVTENLKTNTVWDISGSPYVITSEIQVYPDVTLTIQPGVEVFIQLGATLVVGGELLARGNADNPIKFTSNLSSNPGERPEIGIKFMPSARSARYRPGPKPSFVYDLVNRQLLLDYESGSILEYCIIEYFPFGVVAYDSLPSIQHCTIRNCGVGMTVEYAPEIPLRRWFFLFDNLVENCGNALRLGTHGAAHGGFELSHALLCQNTFRWCETALQLDGITNNVLLFNNQIFGNNGIGITDFYSSYWNPGPLVLLDNNVISHNQQGLRLGGYSCLLHNLITENKPTSEYWRTTTGGGLHLPGPYGMVFNNTIQLNGVGEGGHGDGIALMSTQDARFVIRRNNLGNSVWDMYDLFLYMDEWNDQCETSRLMVVDATQNSWLTVDPAAHIHDYGDNMCAGTVHFAPVASSAVIPAPLPTYPTLTAPEDNAYIPGTNTITFSWNPVPEATRYLVFVSGKEWHGLINNKIVEVSGGNSTQISFGLFSGQTYGMNLIHWFVIAGNDDGWSFPSEIRKFTYSMDPYVVGGRVVDEREVPVGEALVFGVGAYQTLAEENGRYSLIIRKVWGNPGDVYRITKEGYAPCYTFPRLKTHFDTHGDMTLVSMSWRDAQYEALGYTREHTRGTIVGTVVNDQNQPLSNARIGLDQPSGVLCYLDASGDPDPDLSRTGPSGKFMVLNVNPGPLKLTGMYNGRTVEADVTVQADSVTADALIFGLPNEDNGRTPPPRISAIPKSVRFPMVGVDFTSAPMTVTVRNSGATGLTISDIGLTGLDASEFTQTNDCATVPPGGSCTIAVTFAPALPFGKKAAALVISSNDPRKTTTTVKLGGQTPPPKIVAAPKSLNLGTAGLGTTLGPVLVTVSNKGTSHLFVNDVSIGGLNSGEFSQSNTCGSVPAGGSCTVALSFSPIASPGKKTGLLTISSNDPKKPALSIRLNGSGM